MTRKTGAQANGGKIEGRFAALTSSLLARKGQAAPSNSPIADAAEETEAFTPGAGLIPRKLAPQLRPEPQAAPARPAPPLPQAAAPAKSSPAPAPNSVEAPKPQAAPIKPEPPPSEPSKAQSPKPEPPKTARIFAATLQGFAAPQKQSAPAAQGAPAVSMNVINEKSEDAGYPENPSAEDIAALEAEADEVVSYFENFGDPDEAAAEKDRFLGDPLDELDDDFDDFDPKPKPAPASATIAAVASEPVKAGVTVMLDAKEFMRLTIGAGELELSAQELIAEAIEEYLDARGVESLGRCACLGRAGLGPPASKAVDPAED
jgi:hypothetical protein